VLVGALLPLTLIFFGVNMVTVLLVGLGQAHFIHCYIYQYRAKHMNADFFLKLGLGLSSAGLACYYLGDDVMIPAAIIFIIHQFFDDLYLYHKQADKYDYAQLVLVALSCLAVSLFAQIPWAQQASMMMITAALIVGLMTHRRIILYTLTIPFGIALFYVLWDYQPKGWLIPLGTIIISHYLRWMIHVYQTRPREGKWAFLTESSILNVLFLLYAFATVVGAHGEYLSTALQGLFSLQAFVIWTMAHIASTIRPSIINRFSNRA